MTPVEAVTGTEIIPCVTDEPKKNKSVTISQIREGMVTGVKGNNESSYRKGNVNITKENIGLSKVDNTSDAEKPVSDPQKTALDKKVDKVEGKSLSTNDFTDIDKQFLDSLKQQQGNVYGVEMSRGQSDPVYQTWIGKEEFKVSHPILNAFRLAKVKDGKVVGYFDQTNLFKMADGTPSNIIIDGIDVVDDGTDVMLVNTKPFWVINGGTDDTYERRIVGDIPFTYGGDTADFVAPFAVCIGYSVIKDNKQRSIRDNTIMGTTGAGMLGVNIMTTGGWPTTNISRFNYEQYARNKNTDTSSNLPYANAFAFDLDVWCTLLFIKFRTKDVHSQSVCGKGISSNDSAPDASSWGKMTGIRFKKNDNQTYVYYKINGAGFKASETGTTYNFDQVINNYRPKLKMFEAQLAMSYAKENNIEQNTDFTYDGSTYRYFNFQGHNGLAEGEMSGVVVKFFTISVTGWSIPDSALVTDKEVEVCFAQPLIRGRIAGWGDIWMWYSGIDCVMHDSTSIDIYQTKSVNNMTTDNVSTDKNPGESYGFENIYDLIGTRNKGEGYQLENFKDCLIGKTQGGGLHTGECHYNWFTGGAGSGKIGRRGVFFGGQSYYDSCSLRSGSAYNAPTYADTYIGGGFRCTITQA